MKRMLRTLGVLVLLFLLIAAFVWVRSATALHQTWQVNEASLTLPTDADALTRGQRQAVTHGCTECHGADLGGHVVMDEPPIGRMAAPNLTRLSLIGDDPSRQFSAQDWERAIRHGIGQDGHALLFMPVRDFAGMTDADTADLIAYLEQLPPVRRNMPPTHVGPVGRALFAFGQMPLLEARLIDQHAAHPARLEPAATAKYGSYVAQGCSGCHGAHFSGGAVPGMPPSLPEAANLTPDMASGLGHWTKEDFYRALREGHKPDGTPLDPFMPWRNLSQLNDTEIDALWAFLQALPARPMGGH